MPLENLLTLVEKLRERIDTHGDALRQSEALTRYALINPLLRELGWDTGDPDVVVPEYSSGSGRVDYALLVASKPVMMVEAKKLGTSLQDGRKQAVNYALDETNIKARYFSVTDGVCWAIYDTNKPANDMLAASFDLNEKSVASACLKSLALWRPSVISGQIAVGEMPVIELPDDQQSTTEPQPVEESTVQPTSPVQSEDGWQSLSEINPKPKTKPPTEIMFPNDSHIEIDSWISILIEVARWLISNNILDTNHCPIRVSEQANSTRYIVSTQPVHRNDQDFKEPYEMENFHIEKNYTPPEIVKNTRTIIRHVGQAPAQFKVRLP